MLAMRALAFSIHSVSGNGLSPLYHEGDRILINRCSYGLRIEGNGLIPYTRLMRRPVRRGDIVAFTAPGNDGTGLCIARCKAVPGDTVHTRKESVIVPGVKTCAMTDYYWLEAINKDNPVSSYNLGFIPESCIVGRVVTVLYHRNLLRQP